jgi:protein ImuB
MEIMSRIVADTRVAVVEIHGEPAVHAVAQLLADVVALIEVIDEHRVLFPMKGPTRYFGGEEAVLQEVLGRCRGAGLHVGVGVADSRLAATWAASTATPANASINVVPAGGTPVFLAPLPIAGLASFTHVSPDTLSLLARLGLSTLGAVAAVSRTVLSDRFGPAGDVLAVLCSGGEVHPPRFTTHPDAHVSVSEHDHPLESLDAVMHAVDQVVSHAIDVHTSQGMVICRAAVSLITEHDDVCARVWYHPEGFSAGGLIERVRGQAGSWLTGAHAPTAGVQRVLLEVHHVSVRVAHQPGLWGGRSEADHAACRAIARACGVVGVEQVLVPEWRGGRDPMNQYAMVPVNHVEIDNPVANMRRVTPGEAHPAQWSGALGGLAPTVRIEPPLRVEVVDQRGGAVMVNGRHFVTSLPHRVLVNGHTWGIVRWWGPWPVEERWWDPVRHRRMVRLQCIVAPQQQETQQETWLMNLEQRSWWLVGTYG